MNSHLAPVCPAIRRPLPTLTVRLVLDARPEGLGRLADPAPAPPPEELLGQLLASGTLRTLTERGTLFASLPPEERCFVGFYRGCPVAFLNRGGDGDGATPEDLVPAADRLRSAGWMVWEVAEAEHVRMALAAVDHLLKPAEGREG